jgi:hypothetical protein
MMRWPFSTLIKKWINEIALALENLLGKKVLKILEDYHASGDTNEKLFRSGAKYTKAMGYLNNFLKWNDYYE